jgi:hypothetical protein
MLLYCVATCHLHVVDMYTSRLLLIALSAPQHVDG